MKTLTLEQLKELKPCAEGFKWYSQNIKTEDTREILPILAEYRWGWFRWLLVRLLSDKQNRQIAIYCAELVLHIFENACQNDKRAREAIEAAKLYISGAISAEELRAKRNAACAAADAAACAAADAACAAADAAACAAADAACAAAAAADAAACAAADAADATTRKEVIDAIVKKGIELLEGEA